MERERRAGGAVVEPAQVQVEEASSAGRAGGGRGGGGGQRAGSRPPGGTGAGARGSGEASTSSPKPGMAKKQKKKKGAGTAKREGRAASGAGAAARAAGPSEKGPAPLGGTAGRRASGPAAVFGPKLGVLENRPRRRHSGTHPHVQSGGSGPQLCCRSCGRGRGARSRPAKNVNRAPHSAVRGANTQERAAEAAVRAGQPARRGTCGGRHRPHAEPGPLAADRPQAAPSRGCRLSSTASRQCETCTWSTPGTC